MTTIEVRPVSVSSSGLVKMEDRKRPAAYDNEDSAPPSKRQVTANVNGDSRNHHDADIPGKDELEKFQKEAIMRQMQEYKREKVAVESRLNDLLKRSAHHDDHIRNVDAWFSQLLEEVEVLCGKLDDNIIYSAFPSTLLSSDDKSFQAYLESRSKAISSAINELFKKRPESVPEISHLQERIAKLLAIEKTHVNELEKSLLEKKQMEERLETASMRYMIAEKKLDRAKSMTVAKLERQATAGGRGDAGSGLGGTADGGKSDGANGQVDSESFAEAERARKSAVATSAKQTEQLKQLASENENLNAQVIALSLKSSNLSDEDFARTDLFKLLKSQHDEVVKKANNLEFANVELRQEHAKHQAERSAYRMQIDAESQAAISEKDSQLSKAESDLARIRTARDELHADLQMRKSTQDLERTSVSQIKQLIAARDERIQALELEIERLESTENKLDAADDSIEDIPPSDLRLKHANLERQCSMLNQELNSMSAAYKKISTTSSQKVTNLSDLEEKVIRLSAEKSKADQKYFAAMKTKDARDQEVRALRAQNAKSSDIVSQLKDAEASTRALVVNLEKQLSESQDAITTLQTKLRDAQYQFEQKKIQVDGLRKQLEETSTSLAAKDKTMSTSSSVQRKLELQVEELKVDLEDKNKRIEIWKAKGLGSENEHYEVLRALAICTRFCRRNFKDTAIKTCGHVFCRECVEDRLQSRMRKCPNCNKAFGQNDHMRITL